MTRKKRTHKPKRPGQWVVQGKLKVFMLDTSPLVQKVTLIMATPHSVVLVWTAPVGGDPVVSYDVQRAPVVNGVVGAFISIANPEPTGTTYTDASAALQSGDVFEYQVLSVNSAGESVPCPEVTVTIPFSKPNAPTNLVATPA